MNLEILLSSFSETGRGRSRTGTKGLTMKLYRPVGFEELKLMYDTNMRSFPLHVDGQPLYSPAPNLDFATRIAKDWQTKSQPFAGYVTACDVEEEYGRQFPVRRAVRKSEKELWIPGDRLQELNRRLESQIKVTAGHFGEGFRGFIPDNFNFANRDAMAQLVMLSNLLDFSRMDFVGEIHANSLAVFLHYPYWWTCNLEMSEVSDDQRVRILKAIDKNWSKELPELPVLSREEP